MEPQFDFADLPSYQSILMGLPRPRGFPNLMGLHREAQVAIDSSTISARMYFYQIEKSERLMSPEERRYMISILNPEALKRYPVEMPFRISPTPNFGQSCVEIFYGDQHFVMFVEFVDGVGLEKLTHLKQIPIMDCPSAHITTTIKS